MIGVGAKARVAPTVVDRSWIGASSAAELREPLIRDVDRREVAREFIAAELRKTPRVREAPHVDEMLDPLRDENVAKFLAGAGGVADSPNRERHAPLLRHTISSSANSPLW